MKLWIRIVIGVILGAIFAALLGYFTWYYLLFTFHTKTGLFDQLVIPLGMMLGAAYCFAGGGVSGGLIVWKGFRISTSILIGGFINMSIAGAVFLSGSSVEFELWLCVLSNFPIGALTGILVFLVNRQIAKPTTV